MNTKSRNQLLNSTIPSSEHVRVPRTHDLQIVQVAPGSLKRQPRNARAHPKKQISQIRTSKRDRMDELALHPTVKPVQMIVDAIKDVSSGGGLVLDLFGGSGSTPMRLQGAAP